MTHLRQALQLLDEMDDNITERGGDEDEFGRRDLAKIRGVKRQIQKAQSELTRIRTRISDSEKRLERV